MSTSQPATAEIDIRIGGPDDVEWAMGLAPDFASFGLPPWRNLDVFVEECRSAIRTALTEATDDRLVFVAHESDRPLGLVHTLLAPDANTGGRNVVVSDIVVDSGHRGRGVGRMLLDRCHAWAVERGAVGLVLAVFEDNVGARRLYERYGFGADVVRMVRPVDPGTRQPADG